jgi:hypothetical protein
MASMHAKKHGSGDAFRFRTFGFCTVTRASKKCNIQ